VMYPPTANGGH